jgi:hypothetical protein
MVEWYWQGKTEVQGEKHYTACVVDEWMSKEQRWNDTDRMYSYQIWLSVTISKWITLFMIVIISPTHAQFTSLLRTLAYMSWPLRAIIRASQITKDCRLKCVSMNKILEFYKTLVFYSYLLNCVIPLSVVCLIYLELKQWLLPRSVKGRQILNFPSVLSRKVKPKSVECSYAMNTDWHLLESLLLLTIASHVFFL